MSQRRATCPSWGSRFLREHDHFAVDDLIFRKKLRGGFRSLLDFRVGKALFDRSDSVVFV